MFGIVDPPDTEKFPYYIVRFKPSTSEYIKADVLQFPYYIVRFKHYVFFYTPTVFSVSILHSTI